MPIAISERIRCRKRSCGHLNPPGAAFCTRCGGSLANGGGYAGSPAGGGHTGTLVCCGLLVVAIVIAVHFIFGLGSDNYIYRSYDYREIFTYHKEFYRDALRDGRLPLWTPHTFCGWPFAASVLTQTFYPLSLPAVVLQQPTAVILDFILHVAAGAIGMFFLLRMTFGLERPAAMFGGLVFALSGPVLGHGYAGHIQFYAAIGYMPWIFLCFDRCISGLERPRGTPGGGLDAIRRAGPWLWAGGLLLGMQFLTGGIQFVWYTLLTVFLYRIGDTLRRGVLRGANWNREIVVFGVILAIGLGMAAVALLPGAEFVSLSNRAGAGFEYVSRTSFPPAAWATLYHADAGRDISSLWEYYLYAGSLPLLLALVGLVMAIRERRVLILLAIAGLAALYALGKNTPVFEFLWGHVPGFHLFRAPARAGIVICMVVAIVGAIGLNVLVARLLRRGGGRAAAGWAIGLAMCVMTVGDATYFAATPSLRGKLFIPDDNRVSSKNHRDTEQILRADTSWYRYWISKASFRQNHAFRAGARSITGYDNMYLTRYQRFIYHMTDTELDASRPTILSVRTFANAPSAFPFKILGVRHAVYQRRRQLRPVDDPLRRGWFVTRTQVVADEKEALAYMRSDAFAPRDEVVFEAPEAASLNLAAGPGGNVESEAPDVAVTVTESVPERLKIDLGPHPDGYLVLSEPMYPGWRATANGAAVPIYRANSILRCVPVSAGQNTIEMTFSPNSIRVGAAISGVSMLLALTGLVLSRTRPKARGGR